MKIFSLLAWTCWSKNEKKPKSVKQLPSKEWRGCTTPNCNQDL